MKIYNNLDLDIGKIEGYQNIVTFFNENKDTFLNEKKVITFDIETKGLELRNNKLLGFGIGFSENKSRYVVTRGLNLKQLRRIFNAFNKFKCKIVLHNAYFDISQLTYMLGFPVKWDYCTYIMAHALHSDILLRSEDKDRKTSLSLKALCKQYYNNLYGYEDELEEKKGQILKELKLTKNKFTYDMFSDDTLTPYGNYDVLVTYALYNGFMKEIKEHMNNGWKKLSYLLKLKHEVTKIYIKAKVNGIRVDRGVVKSLNSEWNIILEEKLNEIMKYEEVKQVETILYKLNYDKMIEDRIFKQFMKLEKYKKEYDKVKEHKELLAREGLKVITPKEYIFENYTLDFMLDCLNEKSKKLAFNLTNKMLQNIDEKSKFNLKSPNHKKILFIDVMRLKPITFNDVSKTTGERTPKTDKEFMNKYSYIDLVDKIREYSLYVKGVDGFLGVNDETHTKGLWNLTSEDYPINHPNSNLQGTITHRIAQNSINLQQLPSRGSLSVLKKCIIPLKDTHRIVALDYSSCELYILGALSNEPNLVNAIKDNLDLHSNMAYGVWGGNILIKDNKLKEIKELLGKEVKFTNGEHYLSHLDISHKEKLLIIKELMGNMRYNAKSINFGLPYGIQSKGLASNMKVKVDEAEKMLNDYMAKNPYINQFMDKNKDLLCRNGYVEGMHGQRLYMGNSKGIDWRGLKDWKYKDKKEILQELRKSTNYIIQSENAMIIYEALIRLDKKLKELGWEDKVFLMTTIYDACYLSVDNSISDKEIKDVLTGVFEVWYNKDVKFRVDIETGKNFKELQPIE